MDEEVVVAEMAAMAQLREQVAQMAGVKLWSAETNLRLERIEWLLEAAGSPQHAYPHVHVGGTSGKGTVSALTAAILSAHGLLVGLHVSPYVQTLNETWQLDGRHAFPSVVLREALALRELGESHPSPHGPTSFFEFKVALAFKLFREVGVDVAVVEVGLGGSYDATNVLGSGVKVLTNVGLDHVDILGSTVEEIASDKIGIFRPGGRVVSGVMQPSVRRIVQDRCRELGTPLWLLGENLGVRREEDSLVVELDALMPIEVPEVPEDWQDYQVVSAGLAVAAASEVLGDRLDPAACGPAMRSVSLPGRVEVFQRDGRTAVLDGAHNADKVAASMARIRSQFGDREMVGVVALKEGKDAASLIPELAAYFRAVVFTTFQAPPWACLPPEQLAALVDDPRVEVVVEHDPHEAVRRAESIAGSDGLVVVVGSFYLVGNVRDLWVPDEVATLAGGSYGPDA